METIMYYWEDAVEFIHNKSQIDKDTIDKVLELELDYMRTLGLVYDDYFEGADE